jgi:DNA-nicking Smr family endonuclease
MDGKLPPRRSARRRVISEDEHRLWRAVVKDARPLRSVPAPKELPVPLPLVEAKPVSKPKQVSPSHSDTGTIKTPAPRRPAEPPSLTGLDRRTSQKLTRGQIEIEARIDLHGLGRDEAEDRLHRFLTRARAEGLRLVLVITGKGENPFARHTLHGRHYHESPERAGILRAALPVWLAEPRFRTLVAGYQPAHPKHGGGGAFYIWLRKKK